MEVSCGWVYVCGWKRALYGSRVGSWEKQVAGAKSKPQHKNTASSRYCKTDELLSFLLVEASTRLYHLICDVVIIKLKSCKYVPTCYARDMFIVIGCSWGYPEVRIPTCLWFDVVDLQQIVTSIWGLTVNLTMSWPASLRCIRFTIIQSSNFIFYSYWRMVNWTDCHGEMEKEIISSGRNLNYL